MKSVIIAMVLVFAFACGLSMVALTSHDHTLTGRGHTHFAQIGAHAAGNERPALLY